MANLITVKPQNVCNLWDKVEGRGQRYQDVAVWVTDWGAGSCQLTVVTHISPPFFFYNHLLSLLSFPHHGLLQRSLQDAPIDSGFRVRLPTRK